ncbi:MAG: hypothetical protein ACYTE8_08155 [Planctomycetota bacterium]|jgi:hypothetical protein
MKKGYAFVEIVTVIMVMVLISLPVARLVRITHRDIPRSYRAIQANTTVMNILKSIKDDVNTAEEFPKSHGDYTANERSLLITTANNVICYQFEEDKIIRLTLSKIDSEIIDTASWPTQNAIIKWQHLQQNKLEGLEIQTYIEHRLGSVVEKKMANSHLYFVGTDEGYSQ